ncbi:MAG: serine/threonine protein kinase, partial [Planctomycetales bacterium]
MSNLSVEDYKQLILEHKLVEEPQLEKVLAKLSESYGDKPYEVETLADSMVEAKLVTLWQNKVIMEGRVKSLLGGKHQGFFVGTYKLLRHLGTGGMNAVYLAEHTVMRRQVAIKVLSFGGDDDQAFLERFRMESRAIAALDDPNIVRAHDFNNDEDIYYLVMEFVEGKDLHHIIKEKGALPFETAADYIQQSSKGLAHAHQMGLIHRDIKPANLLVDNKKVVKLLDLGIARLAESDEEHSITKTHSDSILGTADYLAPEQALDSHDVDARADIYSLGCTLYFLLTGHPPFSRGSLAQRMLMHQMQEPPSIYEDRPNAPPGLVEICQKMMAKK